MVSGPGMKKRDSIPDASLTDTINVDKLYSIKEQVSNDQPVSISSTNPVIPLTASFMVSPTSTKKNSIRNGPSLAGPHRLEKTSVIKESRVYDTSAPTRTTVTDRNSYSSVDSLNDTLNIDRLSGGKSKLSSASKRYPVSESVTEPDLPPASSVEKGIQSASSLDIPNTNEIMSNTSRNYPSIDRSSPFEQTSLQTPSVPVASPYRTVIMPSPSSPSGYYGEPPLPPNPTTDPRLINTSYIPPEIATPSVPSYAPNPQPGPPTLGPMEMNQQTIYFSPPPNPCVSNPGVLIDSVINDLQSVVFCDDYVMYSVSHSPR